MVMYDTVATDVHVSHVIANLSASIKVSKTFDLVSLYSVGLAVSVKYRREGIVYVSSSVCTMPRKPSFSSTEYGLKSIAINLAMDLIFDLNSTDLTNGVILVHLAFNLIESKGSF